MRVKMRRIPSRVSFIYILLLLWPLCNGFFDTVKCSESDKTYVGSEACKECHEVEYKNFKTHAKKSTSFNSILAMKKGLTEGEFRECLKCHTTGYGKASGFISEAETPQLKNAGCEVCHGPGSVHAETEDPEDVKGKLTLGDCETCHSSERVDAFKFKPLIYGGAH